MSVIFENELTKARIWSAELVGFSPFDAQCLAESVLKGESVAALPGDFVLVVEGGTAKGKTFSLLATSAVAAVPYFYYAENGNFVHGKTVFDVVQKADIPWEWNTRALNCVALLDHCLGEDSLHPYIKRVKPASVYFYMNGRLEIAKTPFPHRIFSADTVSIEDAVETFIHVFNEYCSANRTFALSMSAGIDSRVLLANFLARGIRPVLGTMGSRDSTDIKIAQSIAQSLNLEHRCVDLKAEDYLRYGRDIVSLTSGTKTMSNWHTYIYSREIAFPADSLHFAGANGELFRSYYFDKGVLANIADMLPTDLLLKLLFAYKYSPRRRLAGFWTDSFGSNGAIPKIADIPKECVHTAGKIQGSFLDKLDYIYTFQRVRHFIGNGLALYNASAATCSPFLDCRVVEAGARLPRAARQNDLFHRHLIERTFPELMDFPSNDTGQSLRTTERKLYWARHQPVVGYGIQEKLFQSPGLREIYLDSPHLDQFMDRKTRLNALYNKATQIFNFLITMHFTCGEIERIAKKERDKESYRENTLSKYGAHGLNNRG